MSAVSPIQNGWRAPRPPTLAADSARCGHPHMLVHAQFMAPCTSACGLSMRAQAREWVDRLVSRHA